MFHHFPRLGARVFAVGAVVALAAMITAPANATPTGPLNQVIVQDSSGNPVNPGDDFALSAVDDGVAGSVSATIEDFGTFPCDGATASGTLHTNASTSSVPDPYLTLDTLDITGCQTPIPLVTVGVSLNCDVTFTADPATQTVDGLLTDTTVTGTMHAGTSASPCVHAEDNLGGAACSLDVYGDTAATFDETTQELTIGGSGLTITNGASGCSSEDGKSITLDVPVIATVDSDPTEAINFIP